MLPIQRRYKVALDETCKVVDCDKTGLGTSEIARKDDAEITEVPTTRDDVNQVPVVATNFSELFETNYSDERNASEQTERIRRGWTTREAGTLLIGELLFMLGSLSHLVLEYYWEPEPEKSENLIGESSKESKDEGIKNAQATLQAMLQRLVQMASTLCAKQDKGNTNFSPGRRGQSCSVTALASSTRSAVPRSPASARQTSKVQKGSAGGSTKQLVTTAANDVSVSLGSSTTTMAGGTSQGVFLVPSMTAPQSRAQANKCLASTSAAAHQSKQMASDKAFKEQLDKLLPLHRKVRGRIRKSVVVQRELPLLPKKSSTHSMMTLRIVPSTAQLGGSFLPVLPTNTMTVPTSPSAFAKMVKLGTTQVLGASPVALKPAAMSSIFSGAGLNATVCSVAQPRVTMGVTSSVNLLPTVVMAAADTNTTATPVLTAPAPTPATSGNSSLMDVGSATASTNEEIMMMTNPLVSPLTASGSPVKATSELQLSIPEMSSSTPFSSTSPLSISSLLDISLSGCEALNSEGGSVSMPSADKLLDISLGNSNSSFSVFNDGHAAVSSTELLTPSMLRGESQLEVPSSGGAASFSPTCSPFKGSMENPWINGESNDVSLSSLLRTLESPVKHPPHEALGLDPTSRLSTDVDTQLQCMMNESSIDYVAKFADLAAQIGTVPGLETPKKQSSPL